MNKKITFALLSALTISMLAGCGQKKEAAVETGGVEVPTIKWIQVGAGMPDNYEAWKEHINPYIEDKIGVNVDVEVIPWGSWDQKKSVLVNSGEGFDILFTDQNKYNAEANLGVFADITEKVKTVTPDLYDMIPKDYWKATAVNGKLFAVPTYKDSSKTEYWVWDKNLADKYGIDVNKFTTMESLTEPLLKIKEGENISPYLLSKKGSGVVLAGYDDLGLALGPLGVKIDDESRKVVNIMEQEDIMSNFKILHQWYEQGIINADAPALDETNDYKAFSDAQGWSLAAKTVWGPNMGVEAVAVQAAETVVTNGTVRGSLNGISASSKYQDESLKLLQLVNTDSKVRDALYYGLEGDNFDYTDDGKIDRHNTDWKMAGYTQGTFFNVSQLKDSEFNQWDEVKELNANATPSVVLGFNADTTNVESELANCRAVWKKYDVELRVGALDPEVAVPKLSEELKAAGFDKIVEEIQKQIDAAY